MTGKICLIVDDEPAIRGLVRMILQGEGFHALEADSGPQAFRLLEQLKGVLDLVVTDVMMPGDMDGLDLAYAVRNAFPNITVILMSGFPSPQTTKRPIVDFEFIRKPFKPEAFLSVVKRVVGSSER